MRIKIVAIKDSPTQGIKVDFVSNLGRGEALWASQNVQEGGIYEVELEIPAELTWGEDVTRSSRAIAAIESQDHQLVLRGKVESISGNLAEIRLGNSLLQVEISRHEARVGDFLEIKTKNVLLYDENI